MAKLIPIGARILVDDIEPETSVEARAKAAGLFAVVLESNKPRPTSGIVRAVGSDPLLQELISVGDTVLFSRHAGLEVIIEGHSYRSLELRELAHVIKPEPEDSPVPLSPQGSSDPVDQPSQPVDPQSDPLVP